MSLDGKGWKFAIPGGKVPDEDFQNATEDKLFGSEYLSEIYFKAEPGESSALGLLQGSNSGWIADQGRYFTRVTGYDARFTGKSPSA